jgi:hypothetical protein
MICAASFQRLRCVSPASVAILLALSPTAGLAEAPLTPILGVTPTSLDFGTVPVDSLMDLQVTLSNDADDPQSLLVIDSLTVGGYAFNLPDPPALPLVIPGDGSTVPADDSLRAPLARYPVYHFRRNCRERDQPARVRFRRR